jgi:hypothetical protein
MNQRPIIVFDVNETLLDLDATRPTFDRIFDDPAAMRLWFAGLITYSEALTLAGVYVPFTDIGSAVLRMLAATRGICHVWDTIGAAAAGWQAGLILRDGNAPLDVGPQPNYVGDDLDAIADQLIDRHPSSATAVGLASGSAAK